jgi:hypothetical protein
MISNTQEYLKAIIKWKYKHEYQSQKLSQDGTKTYSLQGNDSSESE